MLDLNRRQFVALTATCACAGAFPALAAQGPVTTGPLANFSRDGVFDNWAAQDFFIVRLKNQLFALSATCTHRPTGHLIAKSSGALTCPKHGSAFDMSGHVTNGPAKSSLSRCAIRLDAQKNVVVDPSKTFEESQWSDPASFINLA